MGPNLIKALRRINHGLRWRWRHARDLLRSHWPRLYLSLRWRMPHRKRSHRLPGVLVVSLTSYPPRFGTLPLTLRSLLRQTVKPDHLILWIAPADFPLLPRSVTGLQACGLDLRVTEDIKSYKKIIPALDEFAGVANRRAGRLLASRLGSAARLGSSYRQHQLKPAVLLGVTSLMGSVDP